MSSCLDRFKFGCLAGMPQEARGVPLLERLILASWLGWRLAGLLLGKLHFSLLIVGSIPVTIHFRRTQLLLTVRSPDSVIESRPLTGGIFSVVAASSETVLL